MTYEEKKTQFHDPIYRKMMKYTCGSVCYNCGSTEGIEYHHIVPLYVGGTNNISNIACLCSKCHKAVHWGGHIKDYRTTVKTGRPHKVSDDVLDAAFAEYTNCQIGTKECKSKIKMAKTCKIKDMSYYKRYVKERGIVSVKNNIDIILKKRGYLKSGEIVGETVYENGTVEVHKWGI